MEARQRIKEVEALCNRTQGVLKPKITFWERITVMLKAVGDLKDLWIEC
jgi:hypothetical protein